MALWIYDFWGCIVLYVFLGARSTIGSVSSGGIYNDYSFVHGDKRQLIPVFFFWNNCFFQYDETAEGIGSIQSFLFNPSEHDVLQVLVFIHLFHTHPPPFSHPNHHLTFEACCAASANTPSAPSSSHLISSTQHPPPSANPENMAGKGEGGGGAWEEPGEINTHLSW